MNLIPHPRKKGSSPSFKNFVWRPIYDPTPIFFMEKCQKLLQIPEGPPDIMVNPPS